MKLLKLKMQLERLQSEYQQLIDQYLPPNGNLNELEDKKKIRLTELRGRLVSLRSEISSIEGEKNYSDEYLRQLEELKQKFKNGDTDTNS